MHRFGCWRPLSILGKPQGLKHRNYLRCRKRGPGPVTGKDVRRCWRPVVRSRPLGLARQAFDDTVGMRLARSRKVLDPANLLRQPQHRHRDIFPERQHLRQSRLRLRACPPTGVLRLPQRHQRHAGNLSAGRKHVVPAAARRVIAGVQGPGFPQEPQHRLRHRGRHFLHALHQTSLFDPLPNSKPP